MNKLQEYKLNVHVEPISGLHMKDYNFLVQLYAYPNKKVELSKNQLVEVDEDNYHVIVTDEIVGEIGRGKVKLKFIAEIPDTDFPDGFRTEISELLTDIIIK